MNGRRILKKPLPQIKLRRRQPKNIAAVKFSRHDQAQSFLLMADLLAAGFSIKHALTFIATINPRLTNLVNFIDHAMTNGDTFASSLRSYISADLYYQLALAEKHGDLIKTIREIGKLLTTQERQRRRLKELLQYPLILLVLLVVLLACLAIFVFPELRTWQQNDGQSSNLGSYAYFLLTFLLTILVVRIVSHWLQWRQLSAEKKLIRLCRLPIIGKCYRYYYHYYLTSILGLMLSRGMSLQEICSLTAKFEETSLLYLFGDAVRKAAQSGEKLIKIIYCYPFLPNELVAFMNKGTPIEQMGEELTAFSAIQFKKLTQAIERLLIYVQPIVFCGIAMIIVGLYLSILLPIYHSLQGVY